MRIAHFADLHHEEKEHEEIKKCMRSVIDRIRKEKPDVITCSGDITNSQYIGLDTKSAREIMSEFRELSGIAPVIVVIGTPSHDGMSPIILSYVNGKYPIHVSTEPEQLYLYPVDDNPNDMHADLSYKWLTADEMNDGGYIEQNVKLIVSQVPAPTREYWQNRRGIKEDNLNISEAMASIFAMFGEMAKNYDCPHIGNGHFSMVGSKIQKTQIMPGSDIAISKEALLMSGAVLWCLGHIHKEQIYHLDVGKSAAYHSGSTYRKDYGERDEEKGFYIHDLMSVVDPVTEKSEWQIDVSTFYDTPTREMYHHEISFLFKEEEFVPDGTNDAYSYNEIILMDIENRIVIKKGLFLKLTIKIFMDEVLLLNQSKLKEALYDKGVASLKLEIERIRRENSREEGIIKAIGLVDKFKELARYRNEDIPKGVNYKLEKLEALNQEDLITFAVSEIK